MGVPGSCFSSLLGFSSGSSSPCEPDTDRTVTPPGSPRVGTGTGTAGGRAGGSTVASSTRTLGRVTVPPATPGGLGASAGDPVTLLPRPGQDVWAQLAPSKPCAHRAGGSCAAERSEGRVATSQLRPAAATRLPGDKGQQQEPGTHGAGSCQPWGPRCAPEQLAAPHGLSPVRWPSHGSTRVPAWRRSRNAAPGNEPAPVPRLRQRPHPRRAGGPVPARGHAWHRGTGGDEGCARPRHGTGSVSPEPQKIPAAAAKQEEATEGEQGKEERPVGGW